MKVLFKPLSTCTARKWCSKKYLNKAKSHAYLTIGHLFKQQRNLPAARHHHRQSLKYNLLQPPLLLAAF